MTRRVVAGIALLGALVTLGAAGPRVEEPECSPAHLTALREGLAFADGYRAAGGDVDEAGVQATEDAIAACSD